MEPDENLWFNYRHIIIAGKRLIPIAPEAMRSGLQLTSLLEHQLGPLPFLSSKQSCGTLISPNRIFKNSLNGDRSAQGQHVFRNKCIAFWRDNWLI